MLPALPAGMLGDGDVLAVGLLGDELAAGLLGGVLAAETLGDWGGEVDWAQMLGMNLMRLVSHAEAVLSMLPCNTSRRCARQQGTRAGIRTACNPAR